MRTLKGDAIIFILWGAAAIFIVAKFVTEFGHPFHLGFYIVAYVNSFIGFFSCKNEKDEFQRGKLHAAAYTWAVMLYVFIALEVILAFLGYSIFGPLNSAFGQLKPGSN